MDVESLNPEKIAKLLEMLDAQNAEALAAIGRFMRPGEMTLQGLAAETIRALSRAEPPQGEARPDQAALNSLRTYQRQIDEDGVQVGVSREALDHVLDWIDRAYLSQASGEGGLREGVLPPQKAEDHGCRERASDERPRRVYGPYGYLIKPHGLAEDEWALAADPAEGDWAESSPLYSLKSE